ncbi:MAG: LacI family DNA-binding transcriptional regulator [bacterium]
MSSSVSILVVAKAAGVSKTTVSRVMNGRLDRFRIGLATQARVRAVARQLGYQPDPVARDIALGKGRPPRSVTPQRGISDGKSQMTEMRAPKQIGVVLSTDSTAATLGLIPGIESVLETADYRLAVIIVPVDPTAARERTARLLNADTAGILCCPTLYPAVSAAMAEKLPVIVLWQGAGVAMLKAVGPPQAAVPKLPSMEGAAPSAPVTMEATPNNPSTDTAVTEPRPPLMPEAEVAAPLVAPPEPVSVPEVEIISPPPQAPEPSPVSDPGPPIEIPVDTAVTEPRPPLMPEAEVAAPLVAPPEPVSVPEVEIISPPPQAPEPSPVSDPGPPIEIPVDTAVTEPRPPLMPESEGATPVVAPPEPVSVPEAEITPPPQAPEPGPVSDPGPPIEIPVDTAVTEHRPPLMPEAEGATPVVAPPEPVSVPEAEIITPPPQAPEPDPVSDPGPPIEIPVDTAASAS